MPTVTGGLDPHMIIELEDGLKSFTLVMLAYAYGVPLILCLIVGWYILILASK
jgi:hypothetical protein